MGKFTVKNNSNYGRRGEVIEIDGLDHDDLTDRQKQLLKPYDETQVRKVSGSKSLEVATTDNERKTVDELEAEIEQTIDLDRLAELSKDSRKGVQKAVEKRLEELEG